MRDDPVKVKICGLKTPDLARAAAAAGADYIGVVFFPKSPRNLHIDAAREVALAAPAHVTRVGLVVNPDDALLDEIKSKVPLDMIQLHGSESPERVTEIRQRTGWKVMKALGVASASDLPAIDRYSDVADQLLVDTKPPKEADRPGGNAQPFDWHLIAGRSWSVPWMLAGGLTVDNVADAIRISGARQIDLSSGVESAPGIKEPELIRSFIAAVRA
ncbi:MAG: phosphoribosylanthranilate isomerase [Pseudomonadota bacterium]